MRSRRSRWRVAFAPWFPLSAGSDAARVSGAIAEVAARHQATPAQVAIAWLLATPVSRTRRRRRQGQERCAA